VPSTLVTGDKVKLIVLAGPQGSGNHVFSKIFALHSDVNGWSELLKEEEYFTPHWREPFQKYWDNVDSIDANIMGGKKFAVTSISIPYLKNRIPKVPALFEFISAVEKIGIEVQPVIIGRDRNILTYQEERLRGGPTWGYVPQIVRDFTTPPFFVSQELLYLYKREYIRSLAHWLNFPLDWDHPKIDVILKEDANAKYVHAVVEETWLDKYARNTMQPRDLDV